MQIALALASLLAVQQAEMKEDPRFKYWTGCKVGSWVKMKMETEQAGRKMVMEQIQKLLEVADDKITVEMSGKMKMGEQEFPVPVQKNEIKAKDTADKVKVDKEGDEEIELNGKKMKCHWYEMTAKAGPREMKMKAWMTMDIPGGTAKVEMSPEGQPKMTMTAVEWEKK